MHTSDLQLTPEEARGEPSRRQLRAEHRDRSGAGVRRSSAWERRSHLGEVSPAKTRTLAQKRERLCRLDASSKKTRRPTRMLLAGGAVCAAPARGTSRPSSRQLRPCAPLRAMQPARTAGVVSQRHAVRVTCQAAKGITNAVSPISDTSSWAELQQHAKTPMPHLRQLLNDEKRCSSMFVSFDGITLDYSRQVGPKRRAMGSATGSRSRLVAFSWRQCTHSIEGAPLTSISPCELRPALAPPLNNRPVYCPSVPPRRRCASSRSSQTRPSSRRRSQTCSRGSTSTLLRTELCVPSRAAFTEGRATNRSTQRIADRSIAAPSGWADARSGALPFQKMGVLVSACSGISGAIWARRSREIDACARVARRCSTAPCVLRAPTCTTRAGRM